MLRDQGPRYNLGFGMPMQPTDKGTGGDHSNAVQKALDGHPVMRFFAVAGASILSMGLAGQVVRGGGLRLAEKIQMAAQVGDSRGDFLKEGIKSFRKIESLFDDIQGVERELVDKDNPEILVKRVGGKLQRDHVTKIDGFKFRTDTPDDPWRVRDEIQQRLVTQARRLPYEAPGFYVAQKALLDPLTGDNKKPENQVNWGNPFDVVGDFAWQTIKNLGLNVVPFEVGSGAAQTGYRNFAMKMAQEPVGNMSSNMLSTRALLRQVGVDASELMDRTMRFSNQSMGAFSSMIDEASTQGKGITDWIRSRSSAAITQDHDYKNSGYARRMFLHARDIARNKDHGRQALDVLPGPFRGMASGIKKFGESYKEIGQTYDNWQRLMGGQIHLNELKKTKPAEYNNLVAYMQKGGGTAIEQFGRASFDLGKGGVRLPNGDPNPLFRTGGFFQQRSDSFYKNILTKELERTAGLKPQHAAKFVQFAEHISPYPGQSAPFPGGENLMERFRFVSNRHHGTAGATTQKNSQDWWNSVTRAVHEYGIETPDSLSFGVFQDAIRNTDLRFSGPNFRSMMEKSIHQEWNFLHGEVLPQYSNDFIGVMKKPFEQFKGQGLDRNRDFLINKTAQRLGINVQDANGHAVSRNTVKQQIWDRGLNPDNLQRLRSYLVDQKEIANPWSSFGANMFGFKSMSMDQAMGSSYFGANPEGVRKEIEYFVNAKTHAPAAGRGSAMPQGMNPNRWDMKLNRVYVGPNGKVIDFGRLGRSMLAGGDSLANEFQVPLIHLKPLQLGGWNSRQSMRNQAAILYADGASAQPIHKRGGEAFKPPNFYIYTKASDRASKGRVFGIRGNSVSGMTQDSYEGLYRPFTTNPLNMVGRYTNIAMGQEDVPSSRMHSNKWKRRFDVNYAQQDNLFFGQDSVISRWRAARDLRPGSRGLTNPQRAAKRFASEGFDPKSITQYESEGLENAVRVLRGYGFSETVLREVAQDPNFRSTFDRFTRAAGENVFDTPDTILPEAIRKMLTDDAKLVTTRSQKQQLRRMQQNLNNLLKRGSKEADYWSLPVPEGVKNTGISRRMDQLRNELYDYMISSNDMLTATPGGSAQGFTNTVTGLISKLDDMRRTGAISATERAEGRAAILSLQVEHARNMTYQAGPDNFIINHSMRTLDEVLDKGVDVKNLFNEFGDFNPANQGGRRGFIKQRASRFFATAPYEKPFQTNPTGADLTFMPTTGTAFRQNPIKTMMGVTGMTWRDPEAMSGGMMPATHMVMRLNRYFETFGLGLDPTRYHGPLDLYARGMVGKRVLPIYAAGATALAVDRTLGGMVNEDYNGDPVHSPLFLGAAARVAAGAQIGLAGVIPGGQTATEKKEELLYGEVPIRTGRYWLLGNTPFKGGRIQYFRPSWYQRFMSGSSFTPEMNTTPLESLAFNQDFSPLKYLDPYHFERQNYERRPYPVTGDMFTGPWGPLNGALNATIGKFLKPQRRMHEEATAYGLAQYLPVGEGGAYFSPQAINPSQGQVGDQLSSINAQYRSSGYGTPSSAPFYGSLGFSAPRGTASRQVRGRATDMAALYSNAASRPGSYVGVYEGLVPYGVPIPKGYMQPRVLPSTEPADFNDTSISMRRFGYQTQELLGIYGFGAASIREGFGFGTKDLAPDRAILEPSSRGYSASRSFWNLNIGGLGDLPLPIEGRFANFELSEIVRRFVPKEPAGTQYINNIPNELGQIYPWLPGASYPLMNVKQGDPYNAMPDAEIRLPGTGYARTHKLFPDQYAGKLGLANIHDILGDIAPWSKEYKTIDAYVNASSLSEPALAKVQQTRTQVEAMRYRNEFTPYRYKYRDPTAIVEHPIRESLGRTWEWLAHRDNYLNTKLGSPRTALEDWERENVYGATFPKWETPYQSFIRPIMDKSSQRDPLTASLSGGAIGYLFGATARAKTVGSLIGGTVGVASSVYGNIYEKVTGDRYIPMQRRKELALEENIDILSYTRSVVNASRAIQSGDKWAADQWLAESKRTMYGADLNGTPESLAMAVPKRKREHFRAMMYAPEQEREQILSTAGRLERRMLQAAWGEQVEQLPDLNEYWQDHELPPPDAEIWSPNLNMDTIKIKMGQSMGLDMSQMGFFPQQVREANLLNPSYPRYGMQSSAADVQAQIKRLLYGQGINGSVSRIPVPYGGNTLELNAGVY